MKISFGILCSFLIVWGCSEPAPETTFVSNLADLNLSQEQKDLINRNEPNSLIYFNRADNNLKNWKIPRLENGTVVVYKLNDKKQWKQEASCIFKNNMVLEIQKRNDTIRNAFNPVGNLMSSGIHEYSYTGDQLTGSYNTLTKEKFSFTYPSPNCINALYESNKIKFELNKLECRDSMERLVQSDEYSKDSIGVERKTLNQYKYANGMLSQSNYQEFRNDKLVLETEETYAYENGLLTSKTVHAKSMNITNEYPMQFEIENTAPLTISKYIKAGSKPLTKRYSFIFDKVGKLTEFVDHRDDIYSRRYSYKF